MKSPEAQEAALSLTHVGTRHARAYPKYNQAMFWAWEPITDRIFSGH
jgi:hypothetical protein